MTVPPGARSCSSTSAGYAGGPHQRSSWRGSLQTCQTRAIGASKRAVMVRVLASASLTTLITVIAALLRRIREELLDAVDAPAPERFEIVEQAMGGPQRRDVAAHALLAAVAGLGDEPRALERADVLVHRGEADRVAAGQVGDRMRVLQHHGEDVAARGVGQRVEERVGLLGVGVLITIRLYVSITIASPASGDARLRAVRDARRVRRQ